MIRKLTSPEIDTRLKSIDRDVDRTKPLFYNPTIGSVVVCGAIRGLDVPVRALASLARRFGEEKFFVLSQNLERIEAIELVEIASVGDSGQLTRELNSQCPGIFTGDLVVCWGSSHRWYVVFDAQLALGILIVRNPHDMTAASAAYSDGDKLHNIGDALAECASYEVQGLSEELQKIIANNLFKSWNVCEQGNGSNTI